MKKILKNSILFIIILQFSSCISYNSLFSKKEVPKHTNFKEIVGELIQPICKNIDENSILYITDFVNESNLKNNSHLGFLLANETKVSILNKNCTTNIKIQDLQLSKEFKIGQNGSRILTRDANLMKINNIKDDSQIVVGSYMLTKQQIIIFLKLMDLQNGNIISINSITKNLNDEFISLEGLKTKKEIENEYISNEHLRPFHL